MLPDGVRRRLVTEDTGQPRSAARSRAPDIQPSTELVELAELPRRYRLEQAAVSQPGGSMMNVVGGHQRAAVWRREDVAVLSEQRRHEIRRQKELDQQRTFVLRFGEIKVNIRFLVVFLCSIFSQLLVCWLHF